MNPKCGLVGLPNVGKSSLFNALTNLQVAAENFAFCTIDPHLGRVEVPDERLATLASLVKPQQVVPAWVEFTDIAGLVKGASQGEGLGNQFLAHIRQTNAVAHILRCFQDANITHVHNAIDPLQDMAIINTELCIADLGVVENSIQKHSRRAQSGDEDAQTLTLLLRDKLLPQLQQGKFVRDVALSAEEKKLLQSFGLLTMKPTIYILNISDEADKNVDTTAVEELVAKEGNQYLKLNIKLEAELTELGEEDRRLFLQNLGMTQPALHQFIHRCYALLGLHTFFTAGPKEVRAWTLPKRASALQAAGEIHNDFVKHFIRAEVISYTNYIKYQGEQGAKAKGALRLEGRDYQVADGDVIYFRTSA